MIKEITEVLRWVFHGEMNKIYKLNLFSWINETYSSQSWPWLVIFLMKLYIEIIWGLKTGNTSKRVRSDSPTFLSIVTVCDVPHAPCHLPPEVMAYLKLITPAPLLKVLRIWNGILWSSCLCIPGGKMLWICGDEFRARGGAGVVGHWNMYWNRYDARAGDDVQNDGFITNCLCGELWWGAVVGSAVWQPWVLVFTSCRPLLTLPGDGLSAGLSVPMWPFLKGGLRCELAARCAEVPGEAKQSSRMKLKPCIMDCEERRTSPLMAGVPQELRGVCETWRGFCHEQSHSSGSYCRFQYSNTLHSCNCNCFSE